MISLCARENVASPEPSLDQRIPDDFLESDKNRYIEAMEMCLSVRARV